MSPLGSTAHRHVRAPAQACEDVPGGCGTIDGVTGPSDEWAPFESRSTPSDEEWADAVHRYAPGRIVEGTVISHHRFGFFIDLGERGHRLIEIPMLLDDPDHPLSPDDYPPVGSQVRAVLLGATDHNRQIRLSMRPSDLERAQTLTTSHRHVSATGQRRASVFHDSAGRRLAEPGGEGKCPVLAPEAQTSFVTGSTSMTAHVSGPLPSGAPTFTWRDGPIKST